MNLKRDVARRIALRAQHLDRPAPAGPAGPVRVHSMIRKLGLIQLDSVNVFARAHYMPLISRLGPYDTALLDRAYGAMPRRLVEQWGHMACLVPPDVHRTIGHLRQPWRDSERAAGNLARIEQAAPGIVGAARDAVASQGAMTATEFEAQFGEIPAKVPEMWARTAGKAAFEHLWFAGEFATAARTPQFERVCDLTERVVPSADSPPDDDAARRELTLRALRHLGIGSAKCIADFYRTKVAYAAHWLRELEHEGLAERVEVEGWKGPVWKDPALVAPRRATGAALLSPFDPLVFERTRLATLFGVHYRIGIYTPAAHRTSGYYSLPFLMGEQIVARYDLKADRASGTLLVNGAFLEPQHEASWPVEEEIAVGVVPQLVSAARWLGLGSISIPDDAPGDGIASLTSALG